MSMRMAVGVLSSAKISRRMGKPSFLAKPSSSQATRVRLFFAPFLRPAGIVAPRRPCSTRVIYVARQKPLSHRRDALALRLARQLLAHLPLLGDLNVELPDVQFHRVEEVQRAVVVEGVELEADPEGAVGLVEVEGAVHVGAERREGRFLLLLLRLRRVNGSIFGFRGHGLILLRLRFFCNFFSWCWRR
jgi:hypothetical protein